MINARTAGDSPCLGPQWLIGWAVFVLIAGCSHRPRAEQSDMIARIERLGGKVKYDDRHEVVEVALGGTNASGSELAGMPVFPELRTLSLFDSPIEDGDLAQLGGLVRLETLYLGRTRVTDAGLMAIDQLTSLKTLGLSDTRVSDHGLMRLASLKNLRSVNVHGTQVSMTGINRLKAALPQIVVHY